MTDAESASPGQERLIIYDIGANNGDDIPYYLKKADLVVAVEANPVLAQAIAARFPGAIAEGRLVVEASVLTTGDNAEDVYFYIHKTGHVLSQFPVPEHPEHYDKVLLPAISVEQLIARHGAPHYIKIDVEHYDQDILRALFAAGIHPPFISAESHSIEVFALLVSLGNYRAFKLVDGGSVQARYHDWPIATRHGPDRHSFPHHAAGPFGDDLPGHWMTADNFFVSLAFEGLGWKDIHATNVREANPDIIANVHYYFPQSGQQPAE